MLFFRVFALKNENAQARNHRIRLLYRSNNTKFREKQGQHLLLNAQALEVRTPFFPHLVPPAIMVWIFVWKYIFEPFRACAFSFFKAKTRNGRIRLP
jgi:hypothetical protein